MAVLRIDNYIDAYRIRAQAPSIHELAARPGREALTETISSRILDFISPTASDTLVDVGCGDGTLLKMAQPLVATSIGVVGSEEERARLQKALPDCEFIAAHLPALPLQTESASKIVCNGVLMYLDSAVEVAAATRDLARIARPGATVWIGEIPEVDEYAHFGMYRGTSMLRYLWHLLTNNGLRAFLGMCRRWVLALVGRDQIVLNSARLFFATPASMIALGERSGLKLKTYFRHKEVDENGILVGSRFRFDYVFEK